MGAGSPQIAQTPPSQLSGIEQTVKDSGFTYKDDGSFIDFKLVFSETKRSHKVVVRKTPDSYLSLTVYEVYGLAYESKDEPSRDIVNRMFEKRYSIGSIILEKPSEKQPYWRIRYRLEFHAGWTAARFKEVSTIVGSTADALERELSATGEDLL